MNDAELLATISQLVDEEHRLERDHAATGLDAASQQRRGEIEVALDQCWDLLRQRRARRDAGQDPNQAEPRAGGTVEGYRQ